MSTPQPAGFFRRQVGGAVDGPYPGATLKAMALDGRLLREDELSKSQDGPWHQSQRVAGLVFPQQNSPEAPQPRQVAIPTPPPPPPPQRPDAAAAAGERVRAAIAQVLASNARFTIPPIGNPYDIFGVMTWLLLFRWLQPAVARRRVTFDIYLCDQVLPPMIENMRSVFPDAPADRPVLAAMRTWPGEKSCAYVTTDALLLQTYQDDSAMGQMKSAFKDTNLRKVVMPLREVQSIAISRPTGLFANSMRVQVNGEDVGGIFAGGVKRNAPMFQLVVESASKAARGE